MKKKVDKKKNERDNRVLFSIVIIIFTLCVIAGVSYAIFNYSKAGTKPNKLTTGTLILVLDDSMGSALSIKNAMPTADRLGSEQTPYQFTLENTGSLNSNYRITLVDDMDTINKDGCQNKLLSRNQIRYMLTKNNSNGSIDYLSNATNQVIDMGNIASLTKNTYQLRMWIDSSITNPADINGKHFHVKVKVEAIQETQTFK